MRPSLRGSGCADALIVGTLLRSVPLVQFRSEAICFHVLLLAYGIKRSEKFDS